MKSDTLECPVEFAIKIIQGKWKPRIIWELRQGKTRYSELLRKMPEVSEKMLTQHLRQLEANGVVTRYIYDERPPRVEYDLTTRGKELMVVLRQLGAWVE